MNKKKIIIFSVAIVVLLIIIVVGATYAFFIAPDGSGAKTDISIDTGEELGTIRFDTNDGKLTLSINEETLKKSGGNPTAHGKAVIELEADKGVNKVAAKYYIYLDITENDLEYDIEGTPELLLQIYNENDELVTNLGSDSPFVEISEVSDVTGEKIKGFDITGYTGTIKIASPNTISIDEEKTGGTAKHEWKVNIIYVNLDINQIKNQNKTVKAEIILQSNNLFADEYEFVGTYATVGETPVTIEKTGYYKLEVWGAQGGNNGGYGGYSTGVTKLVKDEKLYINVGGAGQTSTTGKLTGPYNGGGDLVDFDSASQEGTGGGATHIATVTKSNEEGKTGELKYLEEYKDTANSPDKEKYYASNEILIVAGGGGMSYNYYWSGRTMSTTIRGNGGGYKGIIGYTTDSAGSASGYTGTSGTQTSGYSFGSGLGLLEDYTTCTSCCSCVLHSGGGGFYGGNNGSGGSGYIANPNLTNKHMAAYEATGEYLSNDIETKTITALGVSDEAQADYAKSGNGYARITYCNLDTKSCGEDFTIEP